MRDLFICPRNSLLANWSDACPNAKVYPSIASIRKSKKEEYLFWLHADANSQQWIADCINAILRDFSNPKIVVLSNVPDQAEALQTLGRGAIGYCHAYSSAAVLVEVKAVVMHGGIWLGRELLQSLINVSRSLVGNQPEQISETLKLLTKREREVALKASTGLSNKEIARILKITERTVKAHLSSTFERLGIKDRLQLAIMLNDKSAH
jgi:DNA-binding NarL/FixJ family response regulator